MSPKLPILAFLWLLASSGLPSAAAAEAASVPALEKGETGASQLLAQAGNVPSDKGAQAILHRAVSTMEGRPSLFAKSSHHINLFGKPQLLGTALYMEQQTEKGRLLRTYLKITLGNQQVSTLVEVFDGQRLWTYEHLGDKKLTLVDMNKADELLKGKGKLPEGGGVHSLPGLWGLSKLLRGLEADFVFTVVEQTTFIAADQSGQHQLPVWKLRGAWSPEKLATIFPDQAEALKKGNPANLDKLPEHLPDHVILYLGKDDLFPYEIDYQRKVPKRFWRRDRSESRSILTIKFTEVDFNSQFEEPEFKYNPGRDKLDTLTPSDGTEAFVNKLCAGVRP